MAGLHWPNANTRATADDVGLARAGRPFRQRRRRLGERLQLQASGSQRVC
jgi:hypothetical protein